MLAQGAMLMGLSDMGLGANVFDAVYGASAGAINSTYYLSGEQRARRVHCHTEPFWLRVQWQCHASSSCFNSVEMWCDWTLNVAAGELLNATCTAFPCTCFVPFTSTPCSSDDLHAQ